MKGTVVFLAAGGTGGHIFPALALAEELSRRGHRPLLVTDARFAGYATGFATDSVRTITTGNFAGGAAEKLRGLMGLACGVWQARALMAQEKPVAVVGFGGYPSLPTMLAALICGVPTIIHEQNAVLGRVNRLLARCVRRVALGMEETERIPPRAAHKTVVTGNPVRASIAAIAAVPYAELQAGGAIRMLVLGGSQGASIFSDVVPAATALLPAELRARVRIDQQCRAADLDAVRAAYHTLGISADLATFFADVPARLAGAHLVISRAGASSIAELTAAGRPAILVPLPTAMDDHQTANAKGVADAGGAWVMKQADFTAESLAAQLTEILHAPETLAETARAAHGLGRLDAAARLADVVVAPPR